MVSRIARLPYLSRPRTVACSTWASGVGLAALQYNRPTPPSHRIASQTCPICRLCSTVVRHARNRIQMERSSEALLRLCARLRSAAARFRQPPTKALVAPRLSSKFGTVPTKDIEDQYVRAADICLPSFSRQSCPRILVGTAWCRFISLPASAPRLRNAAQLEMASSSPSPLPFARSAAPEQRPTI